MSENEIKDILMNKSELYDEEELKVLRSKIKKTSDDIFQKIYTEILNVELNQIKLQQQTNMIKTINAKLTFFIVLTIINIIFSIAIPLLSNK